MLSPEKYFATAIEIYYNISASYPKSAIWLTGHSLGGALSALVGLTFGVPTVTFEAPPERLASKRLHLPAPPGLLPKDSLVWHFGHTADPVYMGACTVSPLTQAPLTRRVQPPLVGTLATPWRRLVILG
jgi:lipase ATG15